MKSKEDILRRLYWLVENMPASGYYLELSRYGLCSLTMSKSMMLSNIKLFEGSNESDNKSYVMILANEIYSKMNMPYIEDI
jgi:hypothetical protein